MSASSTSTASVRGCAAYDWIAARRLARWFIGGDVNPDAVRFTAAQVLSEHAWREEVEPTLFPARLVA